MPSVTSAGVAIFGGLTYDVATQAGFSNPMLPSNPDAIAGNGVGVGYATKRVGQFAYGDRAMRWGPATNTEIELGTLKPQSNGFVESRAADVNSAGTAVGFSGKYGNVSSEGTRAVRWDAGTSIPTELGHLGTIGNGVADSQARAINSTGTIVGWARRYSTSTNLGERAVRWDVGSNTATELGHLGARNNGYTRAMASVVNEQGVIAGWGAKYDGETDLGTRAVRWDAGSTVATELGNIGTGPGDALSNSIYSSAINEAGTIVGVATKWMNGTKVGERAVRWDANSTVAVELDSLGTNLSGTTRSVAYDINSSGTVVGTAEKWSGNVPRGQRAVRWNPGETVAIEYGNLGLSSLGSTNTSVSAINDSGVAVGHANQYDNAGAFTKSGAVLWGADGLAVDLDSLIPAGSGWKTFLYCNAISNTGWITGVGGFDPDGAGPLASYSRTFLLLVPSAGTYGRGDANFDTHVNFDDLLILAQHYGVSNSAQDVHVGDLDLNGSVDFDDLLALAQHYESSAAIDESSLGSTFSADWALARAMVPEPASVVCGAMVGLGARRNRK